MIYQAFIILLVTLTAVAASNSWLDDSHSITFPGWEWLAIFVPIGGVVLIILGYYVYRRRYALYTTFGHE